MPRTNRIKTKHENKLPDDLIYFPFETGPFIMKRSDYEKFKKEVKGSPTLYGSWVNRVEQRKN